MFAPGPLVSKNGKGGSEKECDTTRRKSFDEWLDVKQKLDKGLALFFQLDPSRANSDFLQVSSSVVRWLYMLAAYVPLSYCQHCRRFHFVTWCYRFCFYYVGFACWLGL